MRIKPALAAVGVTAALLVPAAPAAAGWYCSIPVVEVDALDPFGVYTGVGEGAGVCVYAGVYTGSVREAATASASAA